jgi:hypothetical protein
MKGILKIEHFRWLRKLRPNHTEEGGLADLPRTDDDAERMIRSLL